MATEVEGRQEGREWAALHGLLRKETENQPVHLETSKSLVPLQGATSAEWQMAEAKGQRAEARMEDGPKRNPRLLANSVTDQKLMLLVAFLL